MNEVKEEHLGKEMRLLAAGLCVYFSLLVRTRNRQVFKKTKQAGNQVDNLMDKRLVLMTGRVVNIYEQL